jgi:hypothetical protein
MASRSWLACVVAYERDRTVPSCFAAYAPIREKIRSGCHALIPRGQNEGLTKLPLEQKLIRAQKAPIASL